MMEYEMIRLCIRKIDNGYITWGEVSAGYSSIETPQVFSPTLDEASTKLTDIIGQADELAKGLDPKADNF